MPPILFVALDDEGDSFVKVSRAGTVVSTMTLTGFEDIEDLTYLGGEGKAEETLCTSGVVSGPLHQHGKSCGQHKDS